ncbi:MAG: hypothetical protein R6V43_12080, partial [Halopseudomonas sp.]
NIMLAQWQQNPLIAHTQVFTAEKRMIAEAGDRISTTRMAPGQGQFSAAVHIQDKLAGQVRLSLPAEPFMAPVNRLFWQLAWAALLLALGAGFMAWRMAVNMRRIMHQLGEWQADSPAPGQHRRDELGGLARQLGRRYQDPAQQPVTSAPLDDAEPSASDETLASPAPLPAAHTSDSKADSHHELALETGRPIEPADPHLPDELGAHLLTPTATAQNTAEVVTATEANADRDGSQSTPSDMPAASSTATEEAVDAGEAPGSTTEAAPLLPPAPLETSVLAIRLGNQEALRRLPRPRLMALLGRYREQLNRACALYNGHIQTLHDGTSLVLFNARECGQDELTHALCCGELLRVLGHDLQVEIADTGITLHLHLALCHAPSLRHVPAEELAEQPACQTLIEQVQYSRNLLLLDSSLANSDSLRQRAVVRRLASQPGIYCIERLQDPYQAMLEQQLNHFYQQRQS